MRTTSMPSAACMRCRRARRRWPSILRNAESRGRDVPQHDPRLPDVRNFAEPDVVTLFFGALNREQDWAPLMPVLNEVADKAGDRLRFSVVHDQAFFERAAHAAQTIYPDMRSRHLHEPAWPVRNLVHAAG